MVGLKYCIYKLLFSRGFYCCKFRKSEPRENFNFNSCLFIVMKTLISKIVKLSHREFPHLVQNRENICTRKNWRTLLSNYNFLTALQLAADSRTIPHQIKRKPKYCPPGPRSLGQLPTRTAASHYKNHSPGPIPVQWGIVWICFKACSNQGIYYYDQYYNYGLSWLTRLCHCYD